MMTIATTGVYSFKNVKVIYGNFQIEGFGEEADDHVVITPKQDVVTQLVSSDGQNVIRNVIADETAEVTIKLLANSQSNLFLTSQYYLLTKELIDPAFPFTLFDVNGYVKASGTNVVQTGLPVINEGSTSQIREWKLLISNLLMTVGPL